MKASPDKWIETLKKSLQKPYSNLSDALKAATDPSNPRIYDQFYVKAAHGYSKFILAPDEKNSFYESNISKSFHLEECEGLVLYQFATKYPANKDQSRDEKAEILMLIDKENEKLLSEIELIDLNPDCG